MNTGDSSGALSADRAANRHIDLSTNQMASLPDDVRMSFLNGSKKFSCRRGDIVYRQGEQPRGIFFVETGLIGLVLLAPQSGKEHLMRFFRSGQFFGHRTYFCREGYHGSATALEETAIMFIPSEVVEGELTRHPTLLRNVVQILAKELRDCETHQIMVYENQTLGRIAQALIYLKEIRSDYNWTRQEIASFCASTVATVIKGMAQLEKQGLIRQDGRTIEIVDRKGLLEIPDY